MMSNNHLRGDDIKLDRSKQGLSDQGAVAALSRLSPVFNRVTSIDFSNNNIGHPTVSALVEMLSRTYDAGAYVEAISCPSPVGEDTKVRLLESSRVTEMDLSSNSMIRDSGATDLAGMLLVNTSLKSLALHDCGIEEAGAMAIARSLEANSTVVYLDLGGNLTRDSGATDLAGMLLVNTSLRSLALYNCGIGEAGAMAIARSLEANSTVVYLDLGGNPIRDSGAIALADMLRVNTSLKSLALHDCGIGEVGASAFAEMLGSKVVVIEGLYFASNPISKNGSRAIVGGLMRNMSVQHISLPEYHDPDLSIQPALGHYTESDRITEKKDLDAFLKALSRHPNITSTSVFVITSLVEGLINGFPESIKKVSVVSPISSPNEINKIGELAKSRGIDMTLYTSRVEDVSALSHSPRVVVTSDDNATQMKQILAAFFTFSNASYGVLDGNDGNGGNFKLPSDLAHGVRNFLRDHFAGVVVNSPFCGSNHSPVAVDNLLVGVNDHSGE